MPPLHPVMVSLQVLQTTPEATGMDSRTRASSSPDEHGRLKPRQDEPSPRRPCVNEPDPRGPCRVSGPPQIIINHGRHAIVASDLSTQIHGELHTSQLGTFSGGICGRILQTKKRLPLSTVQSELTNGGVRPHYLLPCLTFAPEFSAVMRCARAAASSSVVTNASA